jgi:D-glycero-D-manno-heptose 1,7-bisphosphate phosphatase
MNTPLKIAFFDRDGVINRRQADHQYVTSVDQFVFNDGIFEVFKFLADKGFEFIVITNQRGISRGLLTEDGLSKIHSYMISEFRKNGIEILDVFFCPHGDNECNCRKPKPGMLEMAAQKYDIDLGESVLISDEMADVEMGKKFGIGKNICVRRDTPADLFDSFNKD